MTILISYFAFLLGIVVGGWIAYQLKSADVEREFEFSYREEAGKLAEHPEIVFAKYANEQAIINEYEKEL